MHDPSGCDGGRPEKRHVSGVLGALARNTAGNTLAIMAAFLIPLCLLAGSAVDMSRVYLVKTRLQQACDAGVLAGRKVMTQTSGTTLDTAPEAAAQAFFKNNFANGWINTTGRTFVTGRMSDGQVTGTATATTPMAIMGMFGFSAMTQSVNCTARLDIGDSDIMFVLDVTGSMGCDTGSGCSTTKTWTRADGTTGYYIDEEAGSKISSLRSAVKLFRTTLENNKPAAAHIRYGFVPYSSSVNVGALITAKDASYIANTATYPSRELATDIYGTSSTSSPYAINFTTTTAPASYYIAQGQFNQGDMNYGTVVSTTVVSPTPADKAACLLKETRKVGSTNQAIGTWPTSGTVVRELPVWTTSGGNKCTVYKWNVKPVWRYKQVSRDVSTFKTFASVTDPSKISGATAKWQGCIEERDTVMSTTSTTYNSSSLPKDLDPDFVPNTDATRWKPLWPNVVYYRPNSSTSYDANAVTLASSDDTSTTAADDYTNLLVTSTGTVSGSLGPKIQYYGCSAPARRLAEMTEAQFNSYLDISGGTGDFRAFGRTYHDVGMIWGLRLLSPDGLWKADTQAWPGNNPPNRYIVFMTDGDMDTQPNSYHLYGMNRYEGRSAATASTAATLETIHVARFQAVCDAAKDKNITVFVVAFDVGSTVPTTLQDCATPGYAYAATDSTTLENAFKKIALEITRLRLSQ